jgi:hypothetical protein
MSAPPSHGNNFVGLRHLPWLYRWSLLKYQYIIIGHSVYKHHMWQCSPWRANYWIKMHFFQLEFFFRLNIESVDPIVRLWDNAGTCNWIGRRSWEITCILNTDWKALVSSNLIGDYPSFGWSACQRFIFPNPNAGLPFYIPRYIVLHYHLFFVNESPPPFIIIYLFVPQNIYCTQYSLLMQMIMIACYNSLKDIHSIMQTRFLIYFVLNIDVHGEDSWVVHSVNQRDVGQVSGVSSSRRSCPRDLM